MKCYKTLLLTLLCLFFPSNLLGQTGKFHDSRDEVTVLVSVDPNPVTPGSDMVISVVLDHNIHWHTHTNDPQIPVELGSAEDYIATSLHFELPEDSPLTIHEGFTQWPSPVIVEVGFGTQPVEYGVFESVTTIYVPVTIAKDAPLGEATFIIKPVFQVCDATQCLRPTPTPDSGSRWEDYSGLIVKLNIVDISELAGNTKLTQGKYPDFDGSVFSRIHAGELAPSSSEIKFNAFDIIKFSIDPSGTIGILWLLLVAMGGGFLLNLTPCVLPVIPIKIMGLSASAGSRRRTFVLGIWMMLGVLALWLALGVGIAKVASFSAINQLFQYPSFTIVLGLFIGIMAVGMGGLFLIRLPNAVYKVNPKHDSALGSFLFGNMTAILSTPCTAPFMGAAAAWATTQSEAMTITVFGAIGLGMALPYLILAAFPKLVDKMPRSGAASELVKQVMGVLMLAAAVYFVGVGLSGLMQEEGAPPSRTYLWVAVACVSAAGIWLAWKTPQITSKIAPRIIFVGVGLLLSISSFAIGFQLTDEGPIEWKYYTDEVLQAEIDENHITVIEFTAEWCLNCKFLETTVLNKPRIVDAFEFDDVTPIKVDLTGNNESGNQFLNDVGGLRIPLLIIYDGKGKEVFRGDFYTVDQILKAIESARNQS